MESATAKVLVLDNYRPEATRGGDDAPESARPVVRQQLLGAVSNDASSAEFRAFYPLRAQSDVYVENAIRILNDAITLLDQAIEAYRDHDRIASDDCIQQVRGLLPELFVLGRRIGDGFASIALATFHSLENKTDLCNEEQLIALRSGLRGLSLAPYCDFEVALNVQENYEAKGLEPDPEVIAQLAEIGEIAIGAE